MSKPHNIGAPPGSLSYIGDARSEKVRFSLIEFNETDFIEEEFDNLDECLSRVKPKMVKWINVEGVHDTSVIEQIGKLYELHPLTLEDIVHVDQRPKFEDYDDYVISIMKMIQYDDKVHAEQLSLVLLKNTVISFQEPVNGDAFDIIRNRLRHSKGRVRKLGADYLFYALMDSVVDHYFYAIERIGDKLEVIEEDIMENPKQEALLQLYRLKRELIYLRKKVAPMRDMVNNLIRTENKLITENTQVFLRDLQDHITRIVDTVETYRDLLTGIMDIHISTNANKMNEIMKWLTIMSSIFIPVTFIVGVYGMNFEYMPELRSPYGYYITWGVMLTVIGGLVFYFKRKKWL
jgi:magnesium transporter